MRKTEQQQQAHNLYFQTNLSQAQIAKLLDVDRKTIHNWLSEGNWRQQKKLAAHIPSKITEQYYYMLANLNHEILSREHQPYPLTHEVEQLRKLTVCIKNLKNRQTTNESMEAYTHLAERVSREDPELAAKLRPYIQDFIQDRVDMKFADCFADDFVINPKMDEMFEYEIRPEDDDEPLTGPASATSSPAPDDPGTGGQPAPYTPAPVHGGPVSGTPLGYIPETPQLVPVTASLEQTFATERPSRHTPSPDPDTPLFAAA